MSEIVQLKGSAQLAAIELGVSIAKEIVSTRLAVVQMRQETEEFLHRTDVVRELIYSDIEAVSRVANPMFQMLLESNAVSKMNVLL